MSEVTGTARPTDVVGHAALAPPGDLLGASTPDLPPAGRRVRGRQAVRDDWRRRAEVALLVTPALVLFVVFVMVPLLQAGYYSTFRWNGLEPLENFVGLENYREAFGDPVFRGAIRNNFLIVVLSILIQLPLGLAIAMLLNTRIRGRAVLRTLIFVPYVLAEVMAGVIWLMMLQPRGFVDEAMATLGLGAFRQLWVGDPAIVLFTLMVVLTWKYVGFAVILFLAGMQGIPEDLREAAALDGASWWQTQRHVTIPLLGPTIRIWIFLSMIGSLQLFDMVWIMTEGGPAKASETMTTYLISEGFKRFRFGYGSAVAIILFAISFLVALLYQQLVLRRDVVDTGRRRR